MSFKKWKENKDAMGSMPSSDSPATASGEVLRTNMQPQVGSNELLRNPESDTISAIDSGIEHLQNQIGHREGDKVNQFKELWQQMRDKWDAIKGVGSQTDSQGGLGTQMGDLQQRNMLQQHPNMVPASQPPQSSPGMFGT